MNYIKFTSLFKKPEYVFRPRQLFYRIFRIMFSPVEYIKEVSLPWGIKIRIDIVEDIGRSIWHLGIYELIVCEAIHRILNEGDIGVDVGANIGQMTGLMSLRVGDSGKVLSFEPHPEVFKFLNYNIYELPNNPISLRVARIYNIALSDKVGTSILYCPDYFKTNKGAALIVNKDYRLDGEHYYVNTNVLDNYLSEFESISVLKLDVEMHELSVLKGAKDALSASKIQNIIYEDYPQFKTNIHKFLAGYGYRIYALWFNLFGPEVIPLEEFNSDLFNSSSPNYIATIQEEKLVGEFKEKGWKCLRT